MRNLSFALTTRQFIDGSKTVTRRLGWNKPTCKAEPGMELSEFKIANPRLKVIS